MDSNQFFWLVTLVEVEEVADGENSIHVAHFWPIALLERKGGQVKVTNFLQPHMIVWWSLSLVAWVKKYRMATQICAGK
jgi:hypothetical protein